MKRIITILLFLMCSFAIYSQTGVLKNIKGKVEISKDGSNSWVKATEGMSVELSDTISTGFGAAATLDLGNSKVALKPLTRMSVDMFLETSNKVSTSLFLQVGSVEAEVDSSNIKQSFQVQSPYSTASVRGTKFDFDGRKITVKEGTVALFVGKPKRIIQKAIVQRKKEKKKAEEAQALEEKQAAEATGDATLQEEEPALEDEEPALEEQPELSEDFLQEIEQEVASQQSDFSDDGAIFVKQGQSVQVVVELTPTKKTEKKKPKDGEEKEEEASIITDKDEIVSNSTVIADTSVAKSTPKSGSESEAETETPEVFVPPVTKPTRTDITIIWE
ncbi:hypothetical protein EW093_12980 [Thiospirochaeta perfilievii]|uniref:FecR protein domain-containing protein n=1 Tax=Thiospirochaeta perfilievii TaxID=252967 RepID=A0A5C1QDZ0_9SPIO|nr:FecR domain-containing protein [Thiospirochaeta perfilievii]QEN05588.1 hypothetical protein EW093_12980 [Thiospirochaeta perfilievii]